MKVEYITSPFGAGTELHISAAEYKRINSESGWNEHPNLMFAIEVIVEHFRTTVMQGFTYFDDIDDALIEGLSQNQDFFSLLLSNDEMKRQVLGIFSEEIYKSLREA